MIFLLLGVAIVARIVWLQWGGQSDVLRSRSAQYSYRTDVLDAERGRILSDDGRILATSIPYYEIRMDMAAAGLTDETFHANVDSLSVALSLFFKDKKPQKYREELGRAYAEKLRYYLVTPKKVDYLDLQVVRDFPLFRLGPNRGGFIAVDGSQRRYPHGDLARRTIGFINQSGVRLGIEGGFDDQLRGTSGVVVKQKVSGSFWAPVSSPLNIEPVNGIDVVTTLDIELQDLVQQALDGRVLEAEADWGSVVVMEVATGHVKAMANITRDARGELRQDYNYAIGSSMEPGSTFKLVTMLALLDDAKMSPQTLVNTEDGDVQIGPARVVDSHRGYGTITLQVGFEKSSNVAMAKALNRAYATQPSKFIDVITRLGIHKPLELQISGEARPLVKHPSNKGGWDGMTLTMMSYGYAVRMAPIHTLTLYNAVANDGVMIKPLFVSELRSRGRIIEQFHTDTLNNKICSDQTLGYLHDAMEGAVLRGTGRSLLNDRYTVAAKSGTAQIAIGRSGYTNASGGRHYLASMVGYIPADKPRYSIMVVMKTYHAPGSSKPYYGASLSGPIFRDICDRIYTTNYNFQGSMVPQAQGYNPALKAVSGSADGLRMLLDGLMVRGVPPIPQGGVVELDSGKVKQASTMLSQTAGVPDLRGMTLAEALPLAEAAGLRPLFRGMGVVAEQSIAPGTQFEQGTPITVMMTPPKAGKVTAVRDTPPQLRPLPEQQAATTAAPAAEEEVVN